MAGEVAVLLEQVVGRGVDDQGDVPALWETLTEANASVCGATDYGLAESGEGSLVAFDSPDGFDALGTHAPRTLVLRDGDPVARTDPGETDVIRADGSRTVDFHRQ